MKMKTKKLFSLGLFLFSAASVFAGNNEKGIEYYRAGLYDAAKIFFTQQTNQTATEKAENYYYLGQTYYELNQIDSAQYCYQQAIAASPEYPFGYIGSGKLALKKGNSKEADDLFKKANGYAPKKDASVQCEIAQVYSDAGLYDKSTEALEKARKTNIKYSGIYLVEGSTLMKQGKVGDACARYQMAINFNDQDKVAYLKLAHAFSGVNTELALEYLDKLVTMDSEYIPAYALIGDINRELGKYKPALAAYEKFISVPGVPILQHERYAQILYFTDQYEKSLDRIKYVLSRNPDNSVMHRIEAYNNYALKNYALGAEQMAAFLKETPVDKHIYLDYITYGRLLLENKQSEEALTYLLKAAELDATKSEVYKELASAAGKLGDYPAQVKYLEKYLEVEPNAVSADYFLYGQQAIYRAAGAYIKLPPEELTEKEAEFKALIQKGDAAFAEVIERSQNSHLGYYWRANLHSLVDAFDQAKTGKMTGDAQPFYEEAYKFMLNKNEGGIRNAEIIECCRYLGSYYIILKDDGAAAGEYYKQILQIAPDDQLAKQTLDALKIKY
jgi:tetratricopeptide (TPR) repeat protein